MSRGDKVRPTAAVIAATGFTEHSVLTVRLAQSLHGCSGCYRVAVAAAQAERDAQGKGLMHTGELQRIWREQADLIRPGDLYAASGEVSSSLCLKCVEPLPLPRRTCPVHTGTPEPCPECESKIAAGL